MSTENIIRPSVTDSDVRSRFNGTISVDLYQLMCGKWLGGGIGRGVYVLGVDPSLVIKVETVGRSFQNVTEWEVWDDLVRADTDAMDWFAPCHYISPCGTILIQARTTPLAKSQAPKKVPAFFTDLKYQNFGMYDGRVVAHDYGFHKFVALGSKCKLQRAQWYDDDEE